MGREISEHRETDICVRPPRVAVTYLEGGSWIGAARAALSALSSVWGGSGHILIPLASKRIIEEEDMLRLLKNYDPDVFMNHTPTVGEVSEIDPSAIEKVRSGLNLSNDEFAKLWPNIREQIAGNGERHQSLAGQLDEWCSPFSGISTDANTFDATHFGSIRTRGSGPSSSITYLAGDQLHPDVYALDLSEVDPDLALIIESRIGSPAYASDKTFNIIRLPVESEQLPMLVDMAITGQIHPGGWDPEQAYVKSRCTAQREPHVALNEKTFFEQTPFGKTQVGLVKAQSTQQPTTVCVIGETANDHALALLCDRLFTCAAWLPTGRVTSSDKIGRGMRDSIRRLQLRNPLAIDPILVVSTSEPVERLDEIVRLILDERSHDSLPDGGDFIQTRGIEHLAGLKTWNTLADKKSFSIRARLPCGNSDGAISLLTPPPAPEPVAAEHIRANLHWCIDFAVAKHQLPARTALKSSTLAPHKEDSFPEAAVRASRYGVTYLSQNMGYVPAGASPDHQVAKPLLHLPNAEQIFHELARKKNVIIRRSPAGLFALKSVDLWGTRENLAADLAGPTRSILDSFTAAPRNTGDYELGYSIRGIGYLDLEYASRSLSPKGLAVNIKRARSIIDKLVRISVLKRGLILNCERCLSLDFYTISTISDNGFACSMCGHISQLSSSRWDSNKAEPEWFYTLDPVVRKLLMDNGDVPLLAVSRLSSTVNSMLWSPEIDLIFEDGSNIEIDIAIIADGSVTVGEAKSTDKLKKAGRGTGTASERLVRAAQVFNADRIILATSKKKWSTGVFDSVKHVVDNNWKGPKPEVITLTDLGAYGSQ